MFTFTARDQRRYWSKVQTGRPDVCWEWTASRKPGGYGNFGQPVEKGKWVILASHRVAWELTYGAIPEGLDVCHTCDNPPCCNPYHLFLGTHQHNMSDAKRKGRFLGRGGEKSSNHRLTVAQVREMVQLYETGRWTQKQLGHRFGVATTTVGKAVKGGSWLEVPKAVFERPIEGLAAVNAAKRHCPRGHPYEGDNLVIYSGRRTCRICNNEKARRHREK